jgi:MFS family permease
MSIFGSWIQMTALGFLVFDLTKSAVYLGITGFAGGISAWFFTLYAGAAADHYSKRTILIYSQIFAACLGLLLCILTGTHVIQAWHIVAMAFLSGTVAAIEAPSRQAFVAELVDKENLSNAISLNSSLFNLGTAIGPALSGILYLAVGPTVCFGINAVSYVPFIFGLSIIRIPKRKRSPHTRPSIAKIKDGINYSLSDSLSLPLMTMVAIISMFGFSIFSLMPAWSVSVLHGNAGTNGMLQSARGIGALTGALTIAARGHGERRGRLLCIGALTYPAILIAFAFTTTLALAMICTALIGACFVIVYNTANMLLQSRAPDAIRGRVMSMYMLSFLGTAPLGSLVGGFAAHAFGERSALVLCAITALGLISALIARSPYLRRH